MMDDSDEGLTDPRPGLQPESSGSASDTRWTSLEARPGVEESGAAYVPFQGTPEQVAAGGAEGGMSKSLKQNMDDLLRSLDSDSRAARVTETPAQTIESMQSPHTPNNQSALLDSSGVRGQAVGVSEPTCTESSRGQDGHIAVATSLGGRHADTELEGLGGPRTTPAACAALPGGGTAVQQLTFDTQERSGGDMGPSSTGGDAVRDVAAAGLLASERMRQAAPPAVQFYTTAGSDHRRERRAADEGAPATRVYGREACITAAAQAAAARVDEAVDGGQGQAQQQLARAYADTTTAYGLDQRRERRAVDEGAPATCVYGREACIAAAAQSAAARVDEAVDGVQGQAQQQLARAFAATAAGHGLDPVEAVELVNSTLNLPNTTFAVVEAAARRVRITLKRWREQEDPELRQLWVEGMGVVLHNEGAPARQHAANQMAQQMMRGPRNARMNMPSGDDEVQNLLARPAARAQAPRSPSAPATYGPQDTYTQEAQIARTLMVEAAHNLGLPADVFMRSTAAVRGSAGSVAGQLGLPESQGQSMAAVSAGPGWAEGISTADAHAWADVQPGAALFTPIASTAQRAAALQPQTPQMEADGAVRAVAQAAGVQGLDTLAGQAVAQLLQQGAMGQDAAQVATAQLAAALRSVLSGAAANANGAAGIPAAATAGWGMPSGHPAATAEGVPMAMGAAAGVPGAGMRPAASAEAVGVVFTASGARVTLAAGTVIIMRVPWFTPDLKPGLRLDTMRPPQEFTAALLAIPRAGHALKRVIEQADSARELRLRELLPTKPRESNDYSVSRAPWLEFMFLVWVALQYDAAPQPFGDSAAKILCGHVVRALCQHPLFQNRAMALKALLARADPHEALLSAVHIVDDMYVVAQNFAVAGAGKRFSTRAFNYGETARAFFADLIDLGHVEGKEDPEIWVKFSERLVERSQDSHVFNTQDVFMVIDRFVNGRSSESVICSVVLDLLTHDSVAGRVVLQQRMSRQVGRGGEPARVLTVGELNEQAQLHNMSLIADGGAIDMDGSAGLDSSFVALNIGNDMRGQGGAGVVKGFGNMQAWVAEGVVTAAYASIIFNPKRADGMWGIDCDKCQEKRQQRGKPAYTKELSFKEYKEKFNAPPFGQGSRPVDEDMIIAHYKSRCYQNWVEATNKVKAGTATAASVTPISDADHRAVIARAKAEGR